MIYVYDGSLDGFFTAVFEAYENKDRDAEIFFGNGQESCLTETKTVITDSEKAERVKRRLIEISGASYANVTTALRCGRRESETDAYRYIRIVTDKKRNPDGELANPYVLRLLDDARIVGFEAHRFKGFLRFSETENGLMYARYEPDNDITSILFTHFISRFRNCAFIIHDTKRNIVAMYNMDKKRILKVNADEPITLVLSREEKDVQDLWIEYHKTVAIEERNNPKLQRAFLPIKYRKNLTEKQNMIKHR